ncbi:hypothetical protein [Deinococcus yavapaiensis]|uniref:Uncharacterized protein n=1 Tax=Deinococcus yavapaiensis KR-236 TaxID=694435 RepID=A0A318S3I5_9DEIO|nr:hypothetical protein [Deinococcus yavapaiensis]PYE51995.1 hypothetical protein DES52_11341 [Deinococcus yavapaiensis KR-236]
MSTSESPLDPQEFLDTLQQFTSLGATLAARLGSSAPRQAPATPETPGATRVEALPPQTSTLGTDARRFVKSVSDPSTLAAVQGIVEAWREYAVTAEQERTKRHHIEAWRDATLASIASTRAVMSTYLERSFDERRSNFEHLFAALDKAQDASDLQGLQVVLAGILELVKTNPFKDLAEFQEQLKNPAFVLDL